MLRVATGSGTILIKAEKAGLKSPRYQGLQIPTDQMARLGFIARNDSSLYVRRSVLGTDVAPDKGSRANWCC